MDNSCVVSKSLDNNDARSVPSRLTFFRLRRPPCQEDINTDRETAHIYRNIIEHDPPKHKWKLRLKMSIFTLQKNGGKEPSTYICTC